MPSEVRLTRLDLIVLFCIVRHHDDEVMSLMDQGYSAKEAEYSVKPAGIATLHGNKKYITENGKAVIIDDKPVPDGMVNRYILTHGTAKPLYYPVQFYRIFEHLKDAELCMGGGSQVVPTPSEQGISLVRSLEKIPADDWPTEIPVTSGTPDWSRSLPRFAKMKTRV